MIDFDLQEFIDTYDMHAWIKMNKNKIKERKKKLLVSFGSSEVSSNFEDMVAWRFRQRFVVPSSPKEFLGFFGYSRVFLSCTSLGRGDPSNFGLWCFSLILESKSWVYISYRM